MNHAQPDPIDLAHTIKCCEDFLFPGKKMTSRERSLYYHLLRHTRVIGKENGLLALNPLAATLAVSVSSVREDIRSLHERGCIRIDERSRTGHLVTVLLPDEIGGIVPAHDPIDVLDIETIDFFDGRHHLDALLARENRACFYCLLTVQRENCELDHVVSRIAGTDNSYRNIVVACHSCNTTKQSRDAADFIRSLYRRGVLSQVELEQRLSALENLKAGRLLPDL